jgi:hypothetical protein
LKSVTSLLLSRWAARASYAGGHLFLWLLVTAGGSMVIAQEASPIHEPDAVAPAPGNAPPEKISPPVLPKQDSPDVKAEGRSPRLNLDRGEHKDVPGNDPAQHSDRK